MLFRAFSCYLISYFKRYTLANMIRFCAVPVLLLFLASVPPKLVKTKLAQGITVSLPAELKVMTPQDISLRFPSVRAPLGAYSSDDRQIDFSANISATQWPATKQENENLDVAQKFFKASLYNLYDRIEMISEGTYIVHKKKYIFFEFESRLNGSKMQEGTQEPIHQYTFIQYLIEPGKAFVFSFHCPTDHREEWQPVAHEVMKSILIK
jgi:hypothetical protein